MNVGGAGAHSLLRAPFRAGGYPNDKFDEGLCTNRREINHHNCGSETINYNEKNINIKPKISEDPKIKERCNMSSIRGDIFASAIIALVSHESNFNFNVPIPNCGKKMNEQLEKYYRCRYFETDNFNRDEFKNVAFEFLKEDKDNYIKFWRGFSVFSPIPGMPSSKTFITGEIQDTTPLLFGLKIVKDYDNINRQDQIHKGTPYYWLGLYHIGHGQLFKGFSYMHQALTEDENHNHTGAAKRFVTLNSELPIITEVFRFIEKRLNKYFESAKGILTPEDLKNFLGKEDFQDIVVQLVFTVFRIMEIIDMDKEVTESDFVALIERNILFDFCQVVDNILMRKTNEIAFYRHLVFLSDKHFLKFDLKQLKRKKNRIHKLGDMQGKLDEIPFVKYLPAILNSRYKLKDGTYLLDIEKDFVITYGFRNFGGHKIKSLDIIYKNFDNIILECIFNALFFSIELIMIPEIPNYHK